MRSVTVEIDEKHHVVRVDMLHVEALIVFKTGASRGVRIMLCSGEAVMVGLQHADRLRDAWNTARSGPAGQPPHTSG